MFGGFGQVGFGRSKFGQATSDYEPRFVDSDPTDAETNISSYYQPIRFSMYCFSSRVQYGSDSDLLVEISENGGTSYVSAYEDGAFVSPYNGSDSGIDAQQADPQRFTMMIHKTAIWTNDAEIRIRVTASDEYGNVATKVTPVEW